MTNDKVFTNDRRPKRGMQNRHANSNDQRPTTNDQRLIRAGIELAGKLLQQGAKELLGG